MDTPTPGGANPWSTHRQRALALVARYPFAAEVLGLYLALLDTWLRRMSMCTSNGPVG